MNTTEPGANAEHAEGQQHPIGLYLKVWLLLFVLSTLSYMVDYFQLQGYLRWTLIIVFMLLKAGLIVAVFMHFMWEPYTLKVALLVPLFAIVVGAIFIAIEADYTFWTRITYMSGGS